MRQKVDMRQVSTLDGPKIIRFTIEYLLGTRGGAVGLGTALQAGSSRVRFPLLSLEFFIDIILPAAL